jgi:hypothetical protein
VPKKTIYVRDADLPLWEQAETVAQGDSVSGVLADALRQYLAGNPTRTAWVSLVGQQEVLRVRVEPAPGGWLLLVPPLDAGGGAVLDALRRAGVWVPDTLVDRLQTESVPLWAWVPVDHVAGLWLINPEGVRGVDFQDMARRAWPRLREIARARRTITYSELGQQLGGLHPLHQVPAVLDVIQRWCLAHGKPDLTGVVVSKTTGIPGTDYWRQNGWAELSLAERVDRWRISQGELASVEWPESPPF